MKSSFSRFRSQSGMQYNPTIRYFYYLLPNKLLLLFLWEWLKGKPQPLAVERVGS
jgi:hypothetical protein